MLRTVINGRTRSFGAFYDGWPVTQCALFAVCIGWLLLSMFYDAQIHVS